MDHLSACGTSAGDRDRSASLRTVSFAPSSSPWSNHAAFGSADEANAVVEQPSASQWTSKFPFGHADH